MDVLFMVAALVFTAMTEAAALLERFTRDPGSDITLKCLTNISDEWDNLTWDRIRETGVDVIGTALIQDKDKYIVEGNNEHFKIQRTSDIFTLSITNVQPSDSGIYCCMLKKSDGRCIIRSAAILVVADTENALPTTSTQRVTVINYPQNESKSTDSDHGRPEGCPNQSIPLQAMGGSLGLCVALVGFLVYLSYKRRVCQHCRDKANQVMQQQNTSLLNQNNCQDEEALNYAPIHFAKRGDQQKSRQKTTPQSQEETLYAGVKCS